MARNRSLIALALLTGCAKSEPGSEPPTKPSDDTVTTSPECAAKVKELAPWLEKLELEQASHEVDGYHLQVIDREPMPMPRKFDGITTSQWGVAGSDLAGDGMKPIRIDYEPTQPALEKVLSEMFASKPSSAYKELPPAGLLRIDVAVATPWGKVVRVVDAAKKAGYTHAMFTFVATSKLEAPPGVKPSYTSRDESLAAMRRLDEMRTRQCTDWQHAVERRDWNTDLAADARARAKETAEAIAACNCAVDPDELRVQKWIDSHWHRAELRVPVVIRIDGTATTTITLAMKTPWSLAHGKILVAAPVGEPPPIVALVGG